MKKCAALNVPRESVNLDVFMDCAILELAFAAAKEAQLRVGPEAAVSDPAAEEFILTGDP